MIIIYTLSFLPSIAKNRQISVFGPVFRSRWFWRSRMSVIGDITTNYGDIWACRREDIWARTKEETNGRRLQNQCSFPLVSQLRNDSPGDER
jgi:hypothetical protein